MLRSHHYFDKKLNYIDGLISIMFDEEQITNRKNKWICHIQDLNREQIKSTLQLNYIQLT